MQEKYIRAVCKVRPFESVTIPEATNIDAGMQLHIGNWNICKKAGEFIYETNMQIEKEMSFFGNYNI